MQTTATQADAHASPVSLKDICLRLGDRGFCSDLGIRYPYLGGSMAKGISSVAMVEELGKAGMLGFFGAAGLPFAAVEAAVDRLAGCRFPLRLQPDPLPP